MSKHRISAENAEAVWSWFQDRGGIAVWSSINLSNPGGSWTTSLRDKDGNPTNKPNWQSANEPCATYTDPADVIVDVPKEVKRFHVAVRMGAPGMVMKLTDGSGRRLRAALAKAGEDAWHKFDYSTHEAIIYVSESTTTLPDYIQSTRPVMS